MAVDQEYQRAALRRRAEARWQERRRTSPDKPSSETDTRHFIEELQIRQIELEIQLEEYLHPEAYQEGMDLRSVCFFTFDRSGRICKVNRAGAEFLGQDRENLLGHDFTEFLNEDDRPAFRAQLDKTFTGKIREKTEWQIHPKNQPQHQLLNKVWLRIEMITFPEIFECQAVAVDITGRKNAEEERDKLKESERTYRSLFDNIMNAVAHCRLIFEEGTPVDYEYLAVNPSFEKVTGLRDVVGRKVSEVIPGYCRDNPDSLQVFGKVAQTGEPAQWEHYLASLDRWFFFSIYRHAPGEIIILSENISERKRSEVQLRQLSTAVEQSPVTVMITDLVGTIEYVNPSFTRITGHTREDVLGKNPRFLKSGETSAEEYRKLWETITSGGEWRGEFHNRRRDGTLFWERAMISPIRGPSGVITHFIALKEDITAQKSLEDQFRQAQKMESVGRLAGGVAHDFNNALGVIIGHVELAMEQVNPELPIHKNLKAIFKAARHSADLTKQLLAFARKQTVMPRILNLNESIIGTLGMLHRLIGEDIFLDWKPGRNLHPVRLDPAQLDQILTNLVINARDAIAGVGSIILETRNIEDPEAFGFPPEKATVKKFVMISIHDTGQGMEKQVLDHLFEPFFTTKELGKGTGLGLATVYGIVQQNNGTIQVDSSPGEGSTFRICFPASIVNAETAPGEPIRKMGSRGSETILLVEDAEELRGLYQNFLKSRGYQVLSAGSPEEALNIARQHQGALHLLVSDIIMPEMNGRELSEQLAAIQPGIPTLFMSGYTADVLALRGVLDEGTNFLQKPFATEELAEMVRVILDRR
ncbi:MAG: PAS domain S-box protein [Candidatus Ozemobacteraceae bacterium]